MEPLKCMVLADIHHSPEKWGRLVEAVRERQPDLVAIAGDLLPKNDGILAQVSYLPRMRKYAAAIRETGAELVLIPGNDDNQLTIPGMEKGDGDGLWHYVSDRVKEIGGFELCGCPWIRDYPFVYKYWVAAETSDDLYMDPLQLGAPVYINRQNEIEQIPDFTAYLKGKPSIEASLEKTAGMVKDLSSSIWLIHQPPARIGLDLCGSGAEAGSTAVYRFLEEKQPLLSIHGHIHEAPAVNGNIWARKLGRTLCIQPGQLDGQLYYASFELRDGKIEKLTHSVYGNFHQSPG